MQKAYYGSRTIVFVDVFQLALHPSRGRSRKEEACTIDKKSIVGFTFNRNVEVLRLPPYSSMLDSVCVAVQSVFLIQFTSCRGVCLHYEYSEKSKHPNNGRYGVRDSDGQNNPRRCQELRGTLLLLFYDVFRHFLHEKFRITIKHFCKNKIY